MRARGLMALAEIPGEWTSAVARWKILNAPHLVIEGEMRAPSATFEYMLYQALLGAWPPGGRDDTLLERMQAYALKAAREGKQETSWLNPNEAYEAGLQTFIARILDRSVSAEFLDSLETLAQRVALLGALNSLSQITLEGDDAGRARFLSGHRILGSVAGRSRQPAAGGFCGARRRAGVDAKVRTGQSLAQHWPDGHLKLAWTRHLLKLRTELADVFAHGDYQPLEVSGPHRDHVIAFARRRGRDAAIVAVAKSFAPFSQGGRAWPRAESFDGALNLNGYSVEGIGGERDRAAALRAVPASAGRGVEGKFEGASKPARKRSA